MWLLLGSRSDWIRRSSRVKFALAREYHIRWAVNLAQGVALCKRARCRSGRGSGVARRRGSAAQLDADPDLEPRELGVEDAQPAPGARRDATQIPALLAQQRAIVGAQQIVATELRRNGE